ncbi:conserved hypothetical protein [Tenacibaculum litopenaei]|uniref:hypothetical protein n=1 Tax=Tenacibaculum litopenaei TaxID=396016 RepID=UPI003893D82F
MYNNEDIYKYVIKFVKLKKLKHQLHEFPSKAVIIDIWKGDFFYTINIEKEKVGLSIIGEEPEFSSIADKYYVNLNDFKNDLDKLINS